MIYFGYTTMTHGIKGELKCFTDFSLKERVLQKGFPIYINDTLHQITNVRPHKNHYLIEFDHLKDINLVEDFRNQIIYIKKEDLHLKDEVMIEEFIGYTIIEQEEILGNVIEIVYNKSGILLKVSGKNFFYIPYIEYYIQKIDQKMQRIYTLHAKELIV